MTTATICSGLLGLLVFGLGFGISVQRARTGRNIGSNGDPQDPLHKWVCAHANATDYAPMLAVLMILVAVRETTHLMTIVFWVVTAARWVHAVGMITAPTLEQPWPPRFVGAFITHLGGLTLAIAAIAP